MLISYIIDMLKIKKPPKSKYPIPPAVKDAKIKNLDKEPSDKLVTLNLLVPLVFRKRVKIRALNEDKTMIKLMMDAYEMYEKE